MPPKRHPFSTFNPKLVPLAFRRAPRWACPWATPPCHLPSAMAGKVRPELSTQLQSWLCPNL